MKVRQLITKLQEYNQNADVRLLGSIVDKDGDLDDVRDFLIYDIHDSWTLKKPHDMVSIQFTRNKDASGKEV